MGKPAVYDLVFETDISPERLLTAATDFSARRPDLWPGITREQYRVFSIGDHEAEVEEGTIPVHHRYRYKWTDDGVVRATTVDATTMRAGSIWEMRVLSRESGGSRVQIHLEQDFKGLGALVRMLMWLTRGHAYRWSFLQTLAILEREGGSVPPPHPSTTI